MCHFQNCRYSQPWQSHAPSWTCKNGVYILRCRLTVRRSRRMVRWPGGASGLMIGKVYLHTGPLSFFSFFFDDSMFPFKLFSVPVSLSLGPSIRVQAGLFVVCFLLISSLFLSEMCMYVFTKKWKQGSFSPSGGKLFFFFSTSVLFSVH